ncbi:MAG TPA: DUF177 domain-containing protein [Flavipsychrobacter sp.]|jgi:uncharacterized metal-binding protein YceD (DUF177 family)|nr:DUF177 domain-containing protein [Flavipsychrobacter sp.]
MKHNREFEIAWQGLKPGVHTFEYEIDNRFMHEHGETEEDIKDIQAVVKVTFDKQTNFFMLHFDVGGFVKVPCDRCGDEFSLQLWDEFDLLIKLIGEDATEIDEESDVVFIPRHETVIDLSNWLYEFVMLSIPLQRVHPEMEEGKSECNPDVLDLLGQLAEPEAEVKPANEIWKGLDALKDETKGKKH